MKVAGDLRAVRVEHASATDQRSESAGYLESFISNSSSGKSASGNW
jgi:hypothetical protein